MQKIHVLILLLFIGCANVCSAQNEPVIIHPSNGGSQTSPNSGEGTPVPQRSPVYIPSVYLSDYTLLFEECCIGCEIEIIKDEEIVYSTVITNDDGLVEVPSTLSGTCELRLYYGSIVFIGEFSVGL